MRKRTDLEKQVLGKVEVILRYLKIDRETIGYAPLLDIIIYAYAFPEESLTQIVSRITKENYYPGIQCIYNKNVMDFEKTMYFEVVHTIKRAIERAEFIDLKELQLDKLNVILKGKIGIDLEEELLAEIGERYSRYSNDEKIAVYFIKKILKAITKTDE